MRGCQKDKKSRPKRGPGLLREVVLGGRGAAPTCGMNPCELRSKHLSVNVAHATIGNPQSSRSGERKVEQAAGNPGSAVRDGNDYRLPGRKIGYANSRAERQAAVGCGSQIPIEQGAARCFSCPIRIV